MDGADVKCKWNLQAKTLFVFTIGPVQEYIVQARKTQDLYWGSYILSYLTWVAIEKVVKKYGPESVIFPHLKGQPFYEFWYLSSGQSETKEMEALKTPTIPNRFFAILPAKNVEEIRALGLEETVKSEFLKMGGHVYDRLLGESGELKRSFFDQLECFPDVYWVAFPLEDGNTEKTEWRKQLDKIKDYFPADEIEEIVKLLNMMEDAGVGIPGLESIYGLLYSFMDKTLGARKGVRNFKQLKEKGRKCSVCGERNVVVYRFTREEEERLKEGKESHKIRILKNQRAFLLESGDERIPFKYLAPSEGLCGSCLTKRAAEMYFMDVFGRRNVEGSFPSTAEIAILNVLSFPDKLLKSKIEEYKALFESRYGEFDNELLFKENLTKRYFEANGFKCDGVDEFKKLLTAIDERIEELGVTKRKYYALLKFDGDDMGKWLTGELGPDMIETYPEEILRQMPEDLKEKMRERKHLMTPDFHASISRLLKNYSLVHVKEIVEGSGAGKVIYSGGDDVLAIINLNYLLDVMVSLRAAFSGHFINGRPEFMTDSKFIDEEIYKLRWDRVGASMGVVIAHYKEALSHVLVSATNMLEHAKNMDGKDAFAVKLLLRSGESYVARAKWYYDGMKNKEGTIGLLKDLNTYFMEKKVSATFVKKLEKALHGLDLKSLPPDVLRSELNRVVGRSLISNLTEDERKKIKNSLCDILISLYDEVGYDDVIGLLKVLAFLNRGGEE
ncbi:MAG: type III-B CRISPR-associated protein Cas10/Cmr2 [Thermosediminibacteraceae bacterium]|nr:type III-B CRISPR-associated protein Cas10/Cmr2 [Thermosediminibacteraceae bacterium]